MLTSPLAILFLALHLQNLVDAYAVGPRPRGQTDRIVRTRGKLHLLSTVSGESFGVPSLRGIEAPFSAASVHASNASASSYAANVESGLRLIQTTSPSTAPNWCSMEQILALVRTRTGFLDLTQSVPLQETPLQFPYEPMDPFLHSRIPSTNAKLTSHILANVSSSIMVRWLETLSTSFLNRHHQSSEGHLAARWIMDKCLNLEDVRPDNPRIRFSVVKFMHPWGQSSVIARIEKVDDASAVVAEDGNNLKEETGERNADSEPIVILGASLDSFNLYNPMSGAAPGANENGSGSSVIFEVLRVLLTIGFVPDNAIEFHWYSGSGFGLLGSQQIASHYRSKGRKVAGMYNVARTGWDPKAKSFHFLNSIAVASDDRKTGISKMLKGIAASEFKIVERDCGFACSDHYSWLQAGYPATHTFEADEEAVSPFLHQASDDMDAISFTRMYQFSRIAMKFAVGMSKRN
ncbi:hypothetical protein HDU78_005904 [Chytriomyces hyalinus]|nr:hypothetical protein HDU78_005904 [Chytriomyces hyalinus]